MTTLVPPEVGPWLGVTFVTVGPEARTYVKKSAGEVAEVPAGVVTVTSTVLTFGGEVAVMLVSESTVKVAGAPAPKLTALAPVKLVPVIVTTVPPDDGPVLGETPVTVGTDPAT